MLAYSLCSSWSTSTQNTVSLRSVPESISQTYSQSMSLSRVAGKLFELKLFKIYVLVLLYFFTSEVSFFSPQKILYAKFGKQIYYKSLTQLKFRSVILG